MQLEFRFRRVLPILLSLVLLWALFLISAFLLEKKENRNQLYVPTGYTMIARMDAKALFESSLYTLLFEARDPEVFGKVNELIEKRQADQQTALDFGIDYLSDVILFTTESGGKPVYGVLFNLSDETKFNSNFPRLMHPNQALASKDHVGLLLTMPGKKVNATEVQSLKAKATGIMARPHTAPLHIPMYDSKNQPLLALRLNAAKNGKQTLFKSGDLAAQVHAQELLITGDLEPGLVAGIRPAAWTLKPQGFHFSNALFTPEIQRAVQDFLQSNGFTLPEISRFSMNYKGIQLQDGESGLMITPRIELLVEFRDEFNIHTILEANETALSKVGIQHERKTLQAGVVSFAIDSLDPRTLFIGMDPSAVSAQPNDNYFLLQGNIEELTHIEGGGFIRNIIEVLPPFRASQQLLQGIQYSNIQLRPQGGKVKLDGKIQFKKDKYAINELLKFLMTFKG
jgi:hypothetical protein